MLAIRESASTQPSGEGKVLKSIAEVTVCPEAGWSVAEDDVLGRTVDRCVDETQVFSAIVKGVPPLKLLYGRKNGKDEALVNYTLYLIFFKYDQQTFIIIEPGDVGLAKFG